MDPERAVQVPTEIQDWEPLIMDAMPQRFGISWTNLLENIQDAWEGLPDPPCSSAATTVIALACLGTLEINNQIILRVSP